MRIIDRPYELCILAQLLGYLKDGKTVSRKYTGKRTDRRKFQKHRQTKINRKDDS